MSDYKNEIWFHAYELKQQIIKNKILSHATLMDEMAKSANDLFERFTKDETFLKTFNVNNQTKGKLRQYLSNEIRDVLLEQMQKEGTKTFKIRNLDELTEFLGTF